LVDRGVRRVTGVGDDDELGPRRDPAIELAVPPGGDAEQDHLRDAVRMALGVRDRERAPP
jgi:hypothetical protein